MKAETLKKAILQYAMQGKLVEQNPNDEPASILLERIKAEKEQLIKDGKIKKEKLLPPITEDEIPYELPQGWEWVRLVDIGYTQTGTTPSTSHPEYFNGEYPFIKPASILNNGKVNYVGETLTEIGLNNGRIITPNTVLMVCIGGSIGKVGIIDRLCSFNQQINSVTCYVEKMAKYIFYCLFSPYFYNTVLNIAPQTTLPIISKGKWEQILVPLPPLAEQQRIVEKLEQILPLVEEYGKNEEKLSKLNSTLPDKIKQSILQHAVQGKLVPQNPDDEPASVLLSRIKAEKEQLIKDGKIKKEKPLPPITEDEIPFEIPKHWEWCRVNDIGIYKKGPFGSALTKKIFVPKSSDAIKVYEQKNAIQKDATLGEYYISKEYYEKSMKNFTVSSGDVIVSCAGTIGETYVMPDNIELGIINQALMRMTITKEIDLEYFLIYFDIILKKDSKTYSKGSAIKNIPPFEIFKPMLVPLPPLAEQQRIVTKVEELLAIVESLKV